MATIDDIKVSHAECEKHRAEDRKRQEAQTANINDVLLIVTEQTVQIKNLCQTQKWFMGIFATVFGSMLIYLLTHV